MSNQVDQPNGFNHSGSLFFFAPSFQGQYAGWVMSGQKKETCKNCLDELEATLAKGERLELK